MSKNDFPTGWVILGLLFVFAVTISFFSIQGFSIAGTVDEIQGFQVLHGSEAWTFKETPPYDRNLDARGKVTFLSTSGGVAEVLGYRVELLAFDDRMWWAFGGVDSDGWARGGHRTDCYTRFRILKDGEVVYQDKTEDGIYVEGWGYPNGNWHNSRRTYEDENVQINLQERDDTGSYSCWNVESYIYPKIDSDAITVEVLPVANRTVEGEDLSLELEITNSFGQSVDAEIIIDFTAPSSLAQSAFERRSFNLTISQGVTTETFAIPTEDVGDAIVAQPSVRYYADKSNFQGVNYDPPENPFGVDVTTNYFERVLVGTVTPPATEIEIIPREVFLTERISELQLTNEEYAAYISDLNESVETKARIISELSDVQEEQAEIIKNMKVNVAEKAAIINELADNLQEKSRYISLLEAENEEQAELIKAMKDSFRDQGVIVDGLDLTVQEDAVLINQLADNDEELAELIAGMKRTIEEEQELVSLLEGEVERQQELIEEIRAAEQKASLVSYGLGVVVIVLVALISIYLYSRRKKK